MSAEQGLDLLILYYWYVADAKSVWIGEKLLKAVQSFYVDSRAFVCVGNDVSEWFLLNVG